MLPFVAACSSEDDAGADACGVYQDVLEEDPAAVAAPDALRRVKGMLPDVDQETRRAFADLITVADSDLATRTGAAMDEAVAGVRSACLSEHGVEIPS